MNPKTPSQDNTSHQPVQTLSTFFFLNHEIICRLQAVTLNGAAVVLNNTKKTEQHFTAMAKVFGRPDFKTATSFWSSLVIF